MTIVSFNFTKIEAEKKEAGKGKININNNVAITDVGEKDLSLGNEKQKVLSFTFEFTSTYEPKIGLIRLVGDVLYMDDSKKVKQILDDWKKDKKLPKDIMTGILNTILNRSNVQALILSQDVNLPPPILLPKVQVEQKKS
ncbi:hypothetical protein HYU50_01170 [Candidatus Woesearchaeota archaeon]|nr:hypothetical protein [Candidatus Woesearchaeota archaeon]